jgi:hypothetical protein
MVKKNNKKLLWAGIGVFLLAVSILVIYNVSHEGFNFNGKFLAIGDVPTGCNAYGQGTTDNEFICQSGECDVNGWTDCVEQTGDIPTVIFRTNAIIDSSHQTKFNYLYRYKYHPEYGKVDAWIAVDLNADNPDKRGTLTSFRWEDYGGSLGSCSYRGTPVLDEKGLPMTTPDGYQMYWDAKNSQLIIYDGPCKRNRFEFSSDAEIDTSLQSKTPYSQNNQEIMGGVTNAFSCSSEWKIKTSSGSVRESGTATYGAQKSGQYQTNVKRITQGEKFLFPGRINYAIIDTTSACSIDLCNSDNSGVIRCLQDGQCKVKSDSTEICSPGTFCVQSGVGAECLAPFDSEFILDEGFTTSDKIEFDYSIRSDRVSTVQLLFKLVDTRNRDSILASAGPIDVSLPQVKHITFNNPGIVGTYEVVVEKYYNGVYLEPEFQEIRIGNPLELTMSIPYSDLTGTNILAGSPFSIEVEVNENGVPTTDLVTVNIIATLKDSTGKTTVLPIPNPTTKNDVYKYTFVAPTPGLFSVEASSDKFGVESNTEKREAEIRDPKIDISYTNIGFLVNAKPGSLTVTFETKDPYGNYLDTSNLVKIIPSGASTGQGDIDVTSNVVRKDAGKYEFSYNFQSGAYILEISSTAPGYGTQTVMKSPSLNIDETATQKECVSSEDCASGKICNSAGTCVQKEAPITLYLIIIGSIVIVIILIIVIVNLSRRKPKKNNEFDIGGGL